MGRAQEHIRAGYGIVVDLDLEKFFDLVNHDILMGIVAKRVEDKRILKLIRGFLSAVAYALCEERKYRPTYKRVGQLPRRMAWVLRILRDPNGVERDGQVDQTAHTGHNVAAMEAGKNSLCFATSSGG